MVKTTDLDDLISAPAPNDRVIIIDVSDTTQSAEGSTKDMSVSDFLSAVTPGGANTQVQYNNSGAFGADAGFTYDPALGVYVAKDIIFINDPAGVTHTISTEAQTTTDLQGNSVSFNSGTGNGNGGGGNFQITSGTGGSNAGGGNVSLTAGDSGGGDNNGGSITLQAGAGTGAGTGGSVSVVAQNGGLAVVTTTDAPNRLQVTSAGVTIRDISSSKNAVLDTNTITDDRTYAYPDSSGTLALETAASGTFTTTDGKTVTVTNGIITSIV